MNARTAPSGRFPGEYANGCPSLGVGSTGMLAVDITFSRNLGIVEDKIWEEGLGVGIVGCCLVVQGHLESKDKLGFMFWLGI